MSNVRKALWLLRSGHMRLFVGLIRRWLWADGTGIGLAYDPREPLRRRVLRAPLTMRPLEPGDLPAFTQLEPGLAPEDALVRVNARHLLESPLEGCYVGVTDDGPAYLQYLITSEQDGVAREVFGGLFPPLGEGEGLLEFAFTLEPYRGGAVMPTGVVELIEIARQRRIERLVTFVSAEQAQMIKFFTALGFTPYAVRRERRRLLRRRITFEEAA